MYCIVQTCNTSTVLVLSILNCMYVTLYLLLAKFDVCIVSNGPNVLHQDWCKNGPSAKCLSHNLHVPSLIVLTKKTRLVKMCIISIGSNKRQNILI